jgi:hypothetical protein
VHPGIKEHSASTLVAHEFSECIDKEIIEILVNLSFLIAVVTNLPLALTINSAFLMLSYDSRCKKRLFP